MAQFQLDELTSNNPQQQTKMVIRSAAAEDLKQLTDLLTSSFYRRSGWLGWVYPVVKLGIHEDLKQRIKSHKPHYMCLTAVDDFFPSSAFNSRSPKSEQLMKPGLVAGTLELSERQSWPWQPLSPRYVYLSNLAVREDLRRRGIALALLIHAEQLVRSWQFKDMYLHVMEDNVEARKLYRKAGFSLFHAEDTPYSLLGLQPRRLLLHKFLTESGLESANQN